MARIQSKTCGRKPIKDCIRPREIKAMAEDALVKMGRPSRKWGDFKGKKMQDSR